MRFINIIATLIIYIFMISCGDGFLVQPPRAALTAGSFPTSAEDAELAVNACYNSLRSWQINTGGFPILDMMADDATKGSNPGDGTAVSVYDKFQHTSIQGSVERWYKTLYEAIKRTNLVITQVPEIEMDEILQSRIIGEAKYLRAYFYIELIRGFGGVPMVTVPDPPLDLGRTAPEVIMEEIIVPDLEFAITHLPKKSEYPSEDLGRATKGAAEGLLARISLFYSEFDAVISLTESIILSEEYSLMDNFADIFTFENEHNSESIFEISAIPDWFVNGGNQYANTQGVRGSPNKGWGFCRPSYAWISEMEANSDPRLQPTVIFLGEELDGFIISGEGATPDTTYEDNSIIEIECYNQKVWYPGNDSRTSFGHNRRIIRLADIILMRAEALNEKGETQQAKDLLNSIRSRARGDNPDLLPDIISSDQDDIRNAILEERKFELALEGLRFYDLVRTDRAEAILGPLGFIKGKNEVLPIPQSEIDISQGKIYQNPGY